MINESCCFSGHRSIEEKDIGRLMELLGKHIERLSDCGVKRFICGGAMGFDSLAARAVLQARDAGRNISLHLAIPYRGMEKSWPLREKREFESILAAADSVHYIAESYDRDCMLRRNRYMVERSRVCVCYMLRNTGGTAYTVAQALKMGREVINLAMEL